MSSSFSAPRPSYVDQILREGYTKIFEGQTVFLTGSTGSLGGCLLYKLALQLPTRRIYALIRGTPKQAVEKWKKAMPDHLQAIIASKKLEFVIGDIKAIDFGIESSTLEKLRNEVTLVIHTAAKITLDATVHDAFEKNCLPSLEMARIASQFRRLKLLIQISTAYANSFLSDGPVLERPYTLSDQDPEDELASVLSLDQSPHLRRFSSTYAYAKYLMEQLLSKRYPLLPILLVRPTIFGQALRHPYPLYGLEDSTPMNKFFQYFMADRGATQVWHAAEGFKSGTNILDEIPVDFVANACLLHAAARTTGIVHIGSELYHPLTFDQYLEIAISNAPPTIRRDLPRVIFTEDRSAPQCFLAELVQVASRNWLFDCGRSYWLKQVGGPLSLRADQWEIEEVNKKRVRQIYKRAVEKARI
ncbi:Fatty acyl-CoA reductase 1 [Penicillium rolfsii]|nr:Fatty acyl-CoA reductase 1 [Penicillium rolfsii]